MTMMMRKCARSSHWRALVIDATRRVVVEHANGVRDLLRDGEHHVPVDGVECLLVIDDSDEE